MSMSRLNFATKLKLVGKKSVNHQQRPPHSNLWPTTSLKSAREMKKILDKLPYLGSFCHFIKDQHGSVSSSERIKDFTSCGKKRYVKWPQLVNTREGFYTFSLQKYISVLLCPFLAFNRFLEDFPGRFLGSFSRKISWLPHSNASLS